MPDLQANLIVTLLCLIFTLLTVWVDHRKEREEKRKERIRECFRQYGQGCFLMRDSLVDMIHGIEGWRQNLDRGQSMALMNAMLIVTLSDDHDAIEGISNDLAVFCRTIYTQSTTQPTIDALNAFLENRHIEGDILIRRVSRILL